MSTGSRMTAGVRRVALRVLTDARGTLTVASTAEVGFPIRRVFMMREVIGQRADHAHRVTTQCIIATVGSFTVEVSDGESAERYELSDPDSGLLVPPMTWVRLFDFSEGAVCTVLADTDHDESEYVRDWQEFVALRA